MTRQPVLTSSWDARRQQVSHKLTIEGTGKVLLFTDATLRLLQAQIDEAVKAPRVSSPSG